MNKILFVLILLYACKKEDPHISMSLVSRNFISDIEVFENQRISVNEYYQINVKNYLYDTIFIGLFHLHNSDIKAVQSSTIKEYDANSQLESVALPYSTKDDTVFAIPYSSEKQILFLLPDLLDSVGYITYTFGIAYDSSGIKKRRDLILSSKIKDHTLILK
jgi:hypothetical protein